MNSGKTEEGDKAGRDGAGMLRDAGFALPRDAQGLFELTPQTVDDQPGQISGDADTAPAHRGQEHHGQGHRARLRQRLAEGGGDALLDHELIEYLLALAIPRRDTKRYSPSPAPAA